MRKIIYFALIISYLIMHVSAKDGEVKKNRIILQNLARERTVEVLIEARASDVLNSFVGAKDYFILDTMGTPDKITVQLSHDKAEFLLWYALKDNYQIVWFIVSGRVEKYLIIGGRSDSNRY